MHAHPHVRHVAHFLNATIKLTVRNITERLALQHSSYSRTVTAGPPPGLQFRHAHFKLDYGPCPCRQKGFGREVRAAQPWSAGEVCCLMACHADLLLRCPQRGDTQ